MERILPVVLAGGSGTRLWPMSRECRPKQFLPLLRGRRSMVQETLLRLPPSGPGIHPDDAADPADGSPAPLRVREPCLVCNEEHRFLMAEQCREIGRSWGVLLLETVPRGTAPAAALAACHALANGDDPVLLVVPSDGHIEHTGRFREAVLAGVGPAETGRLVTFGVRPQSPETGYGYIRAGEVLDGCVRRVAEFVEKPNRARAERYFQSGDFLWNSGMFLFKASAWTAALARHAPAVLEGCRSAVETGAADPDFFRPGPALARAPRVSIDQAVMEKTGEAAVVPLDAGWSDVGSWPALHAVNARDDHDNALAGDVIALDTTNSLVHASERLVATLGVDRLIVVETADAVLVAAWDRAQQVGDVVARLEALSRSEHREHRHLHRPRGRFETVAGGTGIA